MQSRYEFLSRPEGEPLAYLLDRPGIQKLHLSLLDLRAQRAALSNRLDSKHPQMVELRRQEAEITQQLRAEVEQEVAAVRSHYDAASSARSSSTASWPSSRKRRSSSETSGHGTTCSRTRWREPAASTIRC